MKDFRLNFKIRNNRILRKIEESGYSTVRAFCLAHNLRATELGQLINLKRSPFDHHYQSGHTVWRLLVLRLAEIFMCEPEDLFSDALLQERQSTQAQLEVDACEIVDLLAGAKTLAALPDVDFDRKELAETIDKQLATLKPREEKIIRARFGLDGDEPRTLQDIGKEVGITPECIRQIESKSLRKLRHKSRREVLLPWSKG